MECININLPLNIFFRVNSNQLKNGGKNMAGSSGMYIWWNNVNVIWYAVACIIMFKTYFYQHNFQYWINVWIYCTNLNNYRLLLRRLYIYKYIAVCRYFEGYTPVLSVADPEIVKEVLVKDFQNFAHRKVSDSHFDVFFHFIHGIFIFFIIKMKKNCFLYCRGKSSDVSV